MKKLKKVFIKIKKNILGFVIGIILAGSISIALASGLLSSGVEYDNTNSGLSATTVQGALDEINEKANNSSGGGLYVYAYNTSKVYYTGTNQSTLNSLGTVYGTLDALTTATDYNYGLKYKIEDNMVTEASACGFYGQLQEEVCVQGSTDGSTFATNKEILNEINAKCTSSSYCSKLVNSTILYTYSNGNVSVGDKYTCSVSNSGYAICD